MWKSILLDIFRPLYIIATLLLSVYSFYLLTLTILFWWQKLFRQPAPAANIPTNQETLPVVAIQIPLYNEKAVALRVIDQVIKMDYPAHKLHIQVLDDFNRRDQPNGCRKSGLLANPRRMDHPLPPR